METRIKFRALMVALLVGLQPGGFAQEVAHTYQPADFPADTSRVIKRINFPKSDEDVLVRVFCEVPLSKYGELGTMYCTSGRDNEPYVFAATANSRSVRLEPARVDGVRVPIWFQYTVQFERKAGMEKISLFPHHFIGVEDSGENYIGPQRYRVSKKRACNQFYNHWFTMTIPAAGGNPTGITLANPSDDDDTVCIALMREYVADSAYIPAFRDGVAVSAPYSERWWTVPPPVPQVDWRRR